MKLFPHQSTCRQSTLANTASDRFIPFPCNQVCSSLASADPSVRASLFCRLSASNSPTFHGGGVHAGGFPASSSSPVAPAASSSAAGAPEATPAVLSCGGGRGDSVGIPSSLGDAILERAGEMGCLTTAGILYLLGWCTPRVFSLEGVPPTVTDSLLLRYM